MAVAVFCLYIYMLQSERVQLKTVLTATEYYTDRSAQQLILLAISLPYRHSRDYNTADKEN